jgi:hypothetical protein
MVKQLHMFGPSFFEARKHFVAAGVRARRSFRELTLEDSHRQRQEAPCSHLWSFGDDLPEEGEIDFRVPQSPERWCTRPSLNHKLRAIEAFLSERQIPVVAARFGISEEALFKWLCEAGVFGKHEDGRYSEAVDTTAGPKC